MSKSTEKRATPGFVARQLIAFKLAMDRLASEGEFSQKDAKVMTGIATVISAAIAEVGSERDEVNLTEIEVQAAFTKAQEFGGFILGLQAEARDVDIPVRGYYQKEIWPNIEEILQSQGHVTDGSGPCPICYPEVADEDRVPGPLEERGETV